MPRMIADTQLVFDQLCYPASGPDCTEETEGFRPLSEQVRQLGQLGRTEQGWPTRSRAGVQRLHACAFSAREPLANRTLGDAQRLGNLALCPTHLVQLPGTQAASFVPINGLFGICCVHDHEPSISRPTIIRSLCADQ